MSSKLIEDINIFQNQLNVLLASKYENLIDNQLTAKQVFILELIRTGITSSTDLAQYLQVSTSAVSQLLNKLDDQGYIERTINQKNRRKIEITLAMKSIHYFEQITLLEKEINENIYGQLPKEDLENLSTILKKLIRIAGGE
ncbi:MarR family winged helix-turn-helix transcriptional regulator [Kurthia massiliensis]|uniref:MarR family winged helix-turn-helix transcriptional regulator n=1 Tax=Kurthia massiliensis TaxID=1033739 RepID=UPI000289E8F4|nr:MarR family transcriptional regulator [Kurthia massiliensis]